jgi:N6-L-threonylcarbamoyladenine synthase
VEKLARAGDAKAFQVPKAVAQKATLDFSFSGLKTSLRYTLEKMPPEEIERRKADLCASYQHAVMDALVRKTKLALERGFAGPEARERRTEDREQKAGTADRAAYAGDGGPPSSALRFPVSAFRSVGLSGGVANNKQLQGEIEKLAAACRVPFLRARPPHTGDNAGMIAFAAWAEREAGGVRHGGPDGLNGRGFDLEIAPSLALAR